MKVEYFSINDGTGADGLVPAASAQVDRSARRVVVPQGTTVERAMGTSTTASYTDARTSGAYGSEQRHDGRLTRAEEEVRIGKREVEAGEVVVAKHVETERIREDVPLERERVRVERRPVSEAYGSAPIGEDEIRVPLVEEELVVEKRAVVKEELVISKKRIPDVETVDTEVRRERFEITGDTDRIDDATTRERGRR